MNPLRVRLLENVEIFGHKTENLAYTTLANELALA